MDDAVRQRVIAHVDLDAFYAQVEVKNNPALRGKPLGVVQYNPFGDLKTITPEEDRVFNDSNGSLIAVSYEARAHGVKRNMRGDTARKACPELQLVQVPTAHGKADLTLYRHHGSQVTDILSRLSITEKASIDECYLDITEEALRRLRACSGNPIPPINIDQVHVIGTEGGEGASGWWGRAAEQWQAGERLLACGAAAVADLRAAVWQELGFSCSAGVAHTKILAKLASGLHKPRQQTLVPAAAIPGLLQDLPIPKLRQLGGKFGEEIMQALSIKTVGELAAVSVPRLDAAFGEEQAQWLTRLAHGIDDEEVKQRTQPKSIGCGKTFRGPNALRSLTDVHHWLTHLGLELEERVQVDRAANARLPSLLTVGLGSGYAPWEAGHAGNSVSRSCPLRRPTAAAMAEDALALVKRWAGGQTAWQINSLTLTATNFVAAPTGSSTITRFLKPARTPAAPLQSPPPLSASAGVGEHPSSANLPSTPNTATAEPPVVLPDTAAPAAVTPAYLSAAQTIGPQQQSSFHAGKEVSAARAAAQPSAQTLAPLDAACDCPAPAPHQPPSAQPAGHILDLQRSPPTADPGSRQADRQAGALSGSGRRAAEPAGLWMPSSSGDVDEAVVAELPPDIQREVRLAMQQAARAAHPSDSRAPARKPHSRLAAALAAAHRKDQNSIQRFLAQPSEPHAGPAPPPCSVSLAAPFEQGASPSAEGRDGAGGISGAQDGQDAGATESCYATADAEVQQMPQHSTDGRTPSNLRAAEQPKTRTAALPKAKRARTGQPAAGLIGRYFKPVS